MNYRKLQRVQKLHQFKLKAAEALEETSNKKQLAKKQNKNNPYEN